MSCVNNDCAFIVSLQQSDQKGISRAYATLKAPFMKFLHATFRKLSTADKEDVYHDTFIRLQQSVLQRRPLL